MTHLDEGVLRAYLDHELPTDRIGAIRAHLTECTECRGAIGELRRFEAVVGGALAMLDGPVPLEGAWNGVTTRLGLGMPPSSWWATPLARAAGFVLLLAGGALAAVVPGSPLRQLWDAGPDAPAAATGPETTTPRAQPGDAPPLAGVRAVAGGDRIRIDLSAPAGTEVEIVLIGDRAGVFAAPGSTFSAEDGLLRAETSGGPIRIEFPPGLPTGLVSVNGSPWVEIAAGRLVTSPPGAVVEEGATVDRGSVLVRFRVR